MLVSGLKVLVFDVDGVLTDGRVMLGEGGEQVKQLCRSVSKKDRPGLVVALLWKHAGRNRRRSRPMVSDDWRERWIDTGLDKAFLFDIVKMPAVWTSGASESFLRLLELVDCSSNSSSSPL